MSDFTYTAMRYTPTAKDAQYLAIGASFANSNIAFGYMSQIVPFLTAGAVYPALIAFTTYHLAPPLSKGFYDGIVGTIERKNKKDLDKAKIRGNTLDKASKEAGLDNEKSKFDIKAPSKLYKPSLSDVGAIESAVYKFGSYVGTGCGKLLSNSLSIKNREKFVKGFQKFSRGVNYFWNFATLKKVRDVCKNSFKGFYNNLKKGFKKQYYSKEALEREKLQRTSEMEDRIYDVLVERKIDPDESARIAKETSEREHRRLYGKSQEESNRIALNRSYSSEEIALKDNIKDKDRYLGAMTTPKSQEDKDTLRNLMEEARARRTNASVDDEVGLDYEEFDAKAANYAGKLGKSAGKNIGKLFSGVANFPGKCKNFLRAGLGKIKSSMSSKETVQNEEPIPSASKDDFAYIPASEYNSRYREDKQLKSDNLKQELESSSKSKIRRSKDIGLEISSSPEIYDDAEKLGEYNNLIISPNNKTRDPELSRRGSPEVNPQGVDNSGGRTKPKKPGVNKDVGKKGFKHIEFVDDPEISSLLKEVKNYTSKNSASSIYADGAAKAKHENRSRKHKTSNHKVSNTPGISESLTKHHKRRGLSNNSFEG